MSKYALSPSQHGPLVMSILRELIEVGRTHPIPDRPTVEEFEPWYRALDKAARALMELRPVSPPQSSADIYEQCAQTAECWRCDLPTEAPLHIRERLERQNKVAIEIARAIRGKAERI